MSIVTPAVESYIDRLRAHPDRVLAEMEDHAARAFNERLLTHPELTATLIPVGDGVLIAVKR